MPIVVPFNIIPAPRTNAFFHPGTIPIFSLLRRVFGDYLQEPDRTGSLEIIPMGKLLDLLSKPKYA